VKEGKNASLNGKRGGHQAEYGFGTRRKGLKTVLLPTRVRPKREGVWAPPLRSRYAGLGLARGEKGDDRTVLIRKKKNQPYAVEAKPRTGGRKGHQTEGINKFLYGSRTTSMKGIRGRGGKRSGGPSGKKKKERRNVSLANKKDGQVLQVRKKENDDEKKNSNSYERGGMGEA